MKRKSTKVTKTMSTPKAFSWSVSERKISVSLLNTNPTGCGGGDCGCCP